MFVTSLYKPLCLLQVENWNPLTDTIPIHAWIHPWLPLMGPTRLEPLYAPIRQKLGNALQRWHPSDPSAKLILRPWKEVFSAGSWEAFTVKHILRKLGVFARNNSCTYAYFDARFLKNRGQVHSFFFFSCLFAF